MKERLRWLVYALQMKDDRFLKIILFSLLSRVKTESRSSLSWVGEHHKERFKGMGTSWEGVKGEF